MPLIAALGGNGMQGRHWDQIQEHVGKDVRPRNDTTLKEMLEYNLGSHIEKIEEISVKDGVHRTFTHLFACYSTVRRTCSVNLWKGIKGIRPRKISRKNARGLGRNCIQPVTI